MKSKLTLIPVVLLSFFLANYLPQNPAIAETEGDAIESVTSAVGDTSQNALDWNGVYQGVLPCADCEGIKTTITLNQDLTFIKQVQYLGKDDKVVEKEGSFKWNETGNQITLEGITDAPSQFIVGENRLIQLDMNGDRISGELADKYILSKTDTEAHGEEETETEAQADSETEVEAMKENKITDVRWQLTEMIGKPVTKSENQRQPIFIMFNSEENRVNGFGGCNNFMGGFELKEGNRISFKQMASTMMACENLDTELSFMQTLEQIDNYTINDGILSLHKAKMSPLLKFQLAE